jgi:hypothetical protein
MSFNLLATPTFQAHYRALVHQMSNLLSAVWDLQNLLLDEPEASEPLGNSYYRATTSLYQHTHGSATYQELVVYYQQVEDTIYLLALSRQVPTSQPIAPELANFFEELALGQD